MLNRNPAFVLGMFETGLAVGRSLGRKGIKVVGIDFKKDIGFHSKYIEGQLCPHPIEEEKEFINCLTALARSQECKPVLFVTSDDFLAAIVRNRAEIEKCFLSNLPDNDIILSVADKYLQYKLATKAGVLCPITYLLESMDGLDKLAERLPYPVFVKARDVNMWRKHVSSSTKGYVVNDVNELMQKCGPIVEKGMNVVIQEIVGGSDISNYKICCYISREGQFLLTFTLQKLRQVPVGFGVGSAVVSIDYPELVEVGTRFLKSIGYRGVGSAEFKLDEDDKKLKLIELNPRYWQQNALADKCGMEFPVVDYLEATGQRIENKSGFIIGVKWINLFSDFDAFLTYRLQKKLTFAKWLRSMRGRKVFSDFAVDDMKPALSQIALWQRVSHIPRYLRRRVIRW